MCGCPEEYEQDSLDQDMAQVGQHAFSRMEGDVDKQRRLILQGNLSDAAMQKQHQRKWVQQPPPTIRLTAFGQTMRQWATNVQTPRVCVCVCEIAQTVTQVLYTSLLFG